MYDQDEKMMKMMFLLDLQTLMDSSRFLNMNTTRTSLEKDQQNIPQRGIFSAQLGKEKDEEKQVLNTYL